ncbi:AMP-binding protein [Micromonospora sp. KLBMP9576]|uniref:AMP-binding protein n=1 Tax=Micromonospora sp. KLBMP9576 TaxID=3424769 RepID=UPI003D9390DD
MRAHEVDEGNGTTSVAARVRLAWAEIVGQRPDGTVPEDQAFLSAGGHSLAAARLIARLRGDVAVDVPMSAILRDDPTLAQLVTMVTDRAGAQPAPAPAPATPVAPAPEARTVVSAPLAPTLRRIWTWHRLHPGSPAYNVVRVLAVAGRVQPAALRAALGDLSERHEALRCSVAEPRPDRCEIVVADRVSVPVAVEVLRAGGGDAEQAVDEALHRLADKPFPMAAAPLWRVGVVYVPALDRTYLILVMHHLISDMRSTDIVLAELAEAYRQRLAGAAPAFATAAPSLLAHLRHESALAGTPRWRDDLDWWSRRLAGAGNAAPLPLAAAERDETVHAASTHSVALPRDRSAALDEALRTRRLTPALFFLTVAGAVLSAWAGPGRAEVVGLPSVRVSRPEDERLVGFLLDTLPLPIEPDRAGSFLRAYAMVRDAYADATDHALPPFDEIVERLRLPRTSLSPLIRLWFSDLTQAVAPPTFGAAEVTEYDLPPAWSLFDLGLYLRRGPDGYRLHLVSPRGLLAPADTAALLDQVVRTAHAAADDPQRALGDLLEAPPGGTGTPVAPVAEESTPERLRRTAGERPDAVALTDGTTVLGYRALHDLVRREAEHLRAQAGPGAVVALPARRDSQFVVRLLGCRQAGVTAVPVDADWPVRRRDGAFAVAGVTWAYPWSSDGPAEPVPAATAARGDGPAHVLFTSGTTGEPLPVRVPTPVTEAAVDDLAALLGVDAGDRVSMLSGPAHDPVLRDLGLALRFGATVCVPPPGVAGHPARVAAWLRAERVTVLSATPALLALVLGADPRPMPDLRAVICGGSPLSATTAALVRACAPGATLLNGYGCTETPQLVVAHAIAPGGPLPPTAEVPIGVPLPGRHVEVRATDGRRCDAGHLGELWVAGPHLADGYVGRAAIDRFVTDAEGRRWLRTGDLARRDAAGLLHLAGRTDRQVLVNGYRVMLEELESVARGFAGVTDAVAEVVGDDRGQAVRVWVQRSAEAVVVADDLRAHLAAMLPPGTVPARVVVVDRLDLGETLKPEAPRFEPAAPAGAGPVATDARLRQLAESVLGRPFDPAANFFDAGFTSVSLLRMSAELGDLLGRPVDAVSLFHHPNLRALGTFLFGPPEAAPAAPDGAAVSVADRSDRLARMRASRRQVRTWIQESASGPQ